MKEKRMKPVQLYRRNIKNEDLSAYSVLMAVYKMDKSEYVKEAIDSMLNQTFPCGQFVIVEDGPVSSDVDILLTSYVSAYPEIFTIVKLEQNNGLGNALNQGMKQCRNELVARMDADDVSKPSRCEKQIKAFQSDPGLSIVGAQIHEFTESIENTVSSRIVPTDMKGIRKFARRRSPFNHVTVMFRKSVVEDFGGYAPFHRKEDLELFIKMVNHGIQAVNIDEALVDVRIGDQSLKRRKSWMNCKEYIEIMYNFYKKGYIGKSDMLFVFLGQTAMCALPASVLRILSQKCLRKEAL